MVFSASYDVSFYVAEDNSPTYMFRRQVMWLVLGLAGMGVLTWLDYRIWRRMALWGMLITIVALIIVLIIGGAQSEFSRNLRGASIQPSEMAKLMILIYLAVWMYSKREDLSSISLGLMPLGAILGIVGGLIFIQPDLSAAFTILLLGGIMFYLA